VYSFERIYREKKIYLNKKKNAAVGGKFNISMSDISYQA
jgi:hypothetical protein